MRATSLMMVLGLAACGGAGGDDDGGGPDAGGTPPEFRVDATGQIAMIEGAGAYIQLYDRGFEQPMPTRIATGGDCAVYHRAHPSCPDGCGAGACVADNTCAPSALFASAGDVTITGLTQPATFTPSEYGYTGPTLPADLFADDADIRVTAAGDAIPAFTADLGGVPALVDHTGGGVQLHDGVAETVRWEPVFGSDARIQVALYLGWHGSPWSDLLICESADDGELIIPASVIDPMPYFNEGLFQWPSWIARFRRTWVGDIEIVAASQTRIDLTHTP